LRQQHDYDRALRLLRSVAEANPLNRQLTANVAAAIERIERKKGRSAALVERAIARARKLMGRGAARQAVELLTTIPDSLRNAQVEQLLQAAAHAGREEAPGDRVQATLRAAAQLSRAHEYRRALAELHALGDAYRLGPEHARQIELASQHILSKQTRSEARVREAIEQARKFLKYQSYVKAVRVLEQVPEPLLTPEVTELLREGQSRAAEVETLQTELHTRYHAHQFRGLAATINQLLKLKPNHEQARDIARGVRRKLWAAAQARLRLGEQAAAVDLLQDIPLCEQDVQVRRLLQRLQQSTAGNDRSGASRVPTPSSAKTHAGRIGGLAINIEPNRQRKSWLQRLEQWNRRCLKSRWFPWACGGYFNLALLLVLAFLVIVSQPPKRPVVLTMSFAEKLEEAPVLLEPVREELLEPEPMETEERVQEQALAEVPLPLPLPPLEVIPLTPPTAPPGSEVPTAETGGSLEPTEEPAQSAPAESDQPHEPRPEPPPHAITDGNFSVWTEPEIPIPGEAYSIHIQIRLPDEIEEYPRSDLSGMLIGSDGYRKPFDHFGAELVPIIQHTVEIVIPVVGAQRPVGDVVILRSRLLKSQKVLKLRYDQ